MNDPDQIEALLRRIAEDRVVNPPTVLEDAPTDSDSDEEAIEVDPNPTVLTQDAPGPYADRATQLQGVDQITLGHLVYLGKVLDRVEAKLSRVEEKHEEWETTGRGIAIALRWLALVLAIVGCAVFTGAAAGVVVYLLVG